MFDDLCGNRCGTSWTGCLAEDILESVAKIITAGVRDRENKWNL